MLFPSRTVAITLLGYSIHWYGVMYALAFWLAYILLPKRDHYTWLIIYAALGVLLGGRIGYALFYRPEYFFDYPLQLFAIWHGGMSSHGGFIGVALAIWIWSRKYAVPYLAVLDLVTVPAALGLALGRLGNFINQEIYSGHDAFWDIAAMAAIAGICYAMLRRRKAGVYAGTVIAVFLMLYSISRFFLETIRVQEWPYAWGLTRGQLLTIPLLVTGMVLFLYAYKQRISRKI